VNSSIEHVLDLHPKDLEDLHRSGLSDQTIDSMGCYSADADRISRLTGITNLPSGGYCIQYDGITDQTGETYHRWRLREPKDKMRYVSGRGDDAQLYIPPGFKSLPYSDLLVITEGEKKAAKAVQEGLPAVGVQGVWSWANADDRAAEKVRGEPVSEETAPLTDLVTLAKGYKHVLVLGDSDLVSNPQAKAGFEGLARSLRALGIRASVSYCPPATVFECGEHMAKKQGLDDWLIADRFHAIRSLPALFRAAEVNHDAITDHYNALELKEHFKEILAYSQGIWWYWNKTIWTADDCEKRRTLVAKIASSYIADADRLKTLSGIVMAPYGGTTKDQFPSAISAWCGPIESAIKELRRAAKGISNRRGMDDALAVAQSYLYKSDDTWNRDPYLLAVKNGVVDLRTATLLQALPEQYITRCAGTDFTPNAEAPQFLKFFERVQPDAEVRNYIQCLAGYSSVGKGNAQKFFTFIGSGANGKSTYMGLLFNALGEYAVKGPLSLLAEQSPDKPRNDLAALAGARLVSISELPARFSLDVATIKALTGEDLISARFLNHEFFQFRPCFTPILDTNHPPRPRDPGDAVWRRLVIIPWSVVIPVLERDEDLRENLLKELPGILNWIVQGAKRYLENGFPVSSKIEKATRYLRSSCDDVGNWMDSCVVKGTNLRCQSSLLYAHFLSWSRAEGNTVVLSQKEFSGVLREKGFEARKINGTMNWLGISLASDDGVPDFLRGGAAQVESPLVQQQEPYLVCDDTPELEHAVTVSLPGRLPGGGCAI
jgi:putative DNA primase/helicase